MKALVVDDDRVLADVIAFTLRREGFEVILAHDGETAWRQWQAGEPNIVVLDVNLPGIDGFEVCRRIREQSDTPIILLTVRGEENDVVYGLDVGADDYVTKPFSPRQLVARARAVLRRVSQTAPQDAMQRAGGLSYDANRRELSTDDGKTHHLSPLEGRLIGYLMLNPNQILTIDTLIDHVWGPDGGDRDMLRQLIHRLRSKIEPDPAEPTYIETISGTGYGLNIPSESD
nr:response regulator transcription factor [Anaerolineae bacterium]